MKKLLQILLCLLVFFSSYAQQNLSFIEANQAYNKGNYNKAIDLYEKILNSELHSANLYFNLANSYYKLQKIAPSIYNYEKALNLDPTNKSIKINYDYAKQNRLDHFQNLPKGFLARTYEKLLSMKTDFWAWCAVVAMLIFVVGFVLFYRSTFASQRKIYFGIWSFAFLFVLLSLFLSFASYVSKENTKYAIVFSSEITIQSEPNPRSEVLLKIHEGTKVKILDQLDNWKKVMLINGRTGWIPKEGIKEL